MYYLWWWWCTGGDLKCPADSLQKNGLVVYGTFLTNVNDFNAACVSPVDFNFDGIDPQTLLDNRALWHKACRLKFAQTKLDRVKQNRKRHVVNEPDAIKAEKRQSVRTAGVKFTSICLFCDDPDGNLHECSTWGLDGSLKDMATALHDTVVLSKLCIGDSIANEVKYHRHCLTSFRNRYRTNVRQSAYDSPTQQDRETIDARSFADLVYHVEDEVGNGNYIFKLADLHRLLSTRRIDLGLEVEVNTGRLRHRLLGHFGNQCQEQSDGFSKLLVFNEGMQKILREATKVDEVDVQLFQMMRVIQSVRTDIFNHPSFKFDGAFSPECQSDLPSSLKTLVSLLLRGADITDQDRVDSQSCLTIAQLIVFNAKKSSARVVTALNESVGSEKNPYHCISDSIYIPKAEQNTGATDAQPRSQCQL